MSIDTLQDQWPPRAEAFSPHKHVSRTTPDLAQPADDRLPTRLVDRFGRAKTYLRLSVTDRCNLACTYCVPEEGVPLAQREDFLTFAHLERLAEIGARLGITKFRVTGGEPTIRPGLTTFIRRLNQLPGITSVGLTTNGVLLADLARPLAEAGLRTINISIDSLDPHRFAVITRGGQLAPVLDGIEAALAAGLEVKLNTVALNDLTLEEAERLVEFGRQRDLELRFIEFMPLCGTGWRQEAFRPLTGLIDALQERYALRPLPADGGVATVWQHVDSPGKVGFIASLSANFCGSCSRLRFTATGILRPCLFSPIGVDFRPLLLNERSDEELIWAYHQAVMNKPEGHGLKAEEDWQGGEQVASWIRSTGG